MAASRSGPSVRRMDEGWTVASTDGARSDGTSRPRSWLTLNDGAEQRLGRRRPEAHEDRRAQRPQLGLEPRPAGVDLGGVRRLVQPHLAPRLPLEVLHDVGDVGQPPVDARRLQRRRRAPGRRDPRRARPRGPPCRPAARPRGRARPSARPRRTPSGWRAPRGRTPCRWPPADRSASSVGSGGTSSSAGLGGRARGIGPSRRPCRSAAAALRGAPC